MLLTLFLSFRHSLQLSDQLSCPRTHSSKPQMTGCRKWSSNITG